MQLNPSSDGAIQHGDHLVRFINRLRAAPDLRAAERELEGMPLPLRGGAYSNGVTVLGSKAPPAWRRAAKGILFASERPYFR